MRGSSGAACDSDAERIDRRLRGSSRHCCFGVGANEVGASVCILDRIARSGGLGTSGGGIRHRRNALARRDICRGSEFCNSGDHRRGIESRLGKAGYEPKEDWLMPRLMRLRMLVSAFGPHNIRASGAAIHSTFPRATSGAAKRMGSSCMLTDASSATGRGLPEIHGHVAWPYRSYRTSSGPSGRWRHHDCGCSAGWRVSARRAADARRRCARMALHC